MKNQTGYFSENKLFSFPGSFSLKWKKRNETKLWSMKKTTTKEDILNYFHRTSLVAQWLRICLPKEGTRVRALVREDPTFCRATKPVRHNYWACALEPTSHNYWAHMPQILKPGRLEPMLCTKRSHCNEKTAHHNEE